MKVNRRDLLMAGAAAAAAASATRVSAALPISTLRLIDPALEPESRELLGAMGVGDMQPIDNDLVRQWRDGLGAAVMQAGGASAYVRWDKAMLLTGLSRESGLSSRQKRLGRSVFLVSIS